MKTPHPRSVFLAAASLAFALACARADENSSSIKFSDPGKPGTVKIILGRGELTVQGADVAEVTVKSDAKAVTSQPRRDGLRVISAASGFALSEKDNVVTVDSAGHDWGRSGGDLRLTVPKNTMIVVQNAWGGDIKVRNIGGDIDINATHGEIRLDDVSGGIVAGTMHGEIRANLRELREGKPVSFTTMNGEVQIRVPENTKASVRLRTQNGSVLTDFEESALVTRTEATSGYSRGKSVYLHRPGKIITTEVEDAIREATRVSAQAVKEALEAVKQGLEDSRIESDEAKRQLEEARREIDKARREVERERRVATVERGAPAAPTAPGSPKPPVPPKIPAMPTITGGKLVTGTLNGGGPEISVTTMNGDVILRKQEANR